MTKQRRIMKLGAFWYPTGYHIAAWRHPDVMPGAGVDIQQCIDFAKLAEKACFDFIFFADSLAVKGDDWHVLSRGAHRYVGQFEPITLLAALSAATRNIGLIATASTTYHHPYHLARQFASLAHISNGRVGWNLVTSQNPFESKNFGNEIFPPHDERYKRAEEFVDVVQGLWQSWDADAFSYNKQSGEFFDVRKMRPLNHNGLFFQVRGPLNIPACPGGPPIIVQAGTSEAGRRLAARTCDVIFSAQYDFLAAQQEYHGLKQQARAFSRDAGKPVIMTGILPFIGSTEKKAQDRYEEFQSLIDESVGLSFLEMQLGGIDLSHYDLDGPLPSLPLTEGSQSKQQRIVSMAQEQKLSIRQLYRHLAGSRGHKLLIGSPRKIADHMEHWFREHAADGFNIMAPWLPGGMDDFVELVIPELKRRGLIRSNYIGSTLRSYLEM
ncbi:FMN-dependent oxidoreductase (nitrilotriacetate monooxygenase family) [Pantoea agglomerans]|jgi:FMN-dependent oxidoreductase (nitrilotriacetate monooxygenase family)|uniref:LLM class flavin-dependent oxidoreductase n=1 Tax=Enterobacter agglomerans TaxID=549 RepID=UPI00104A0B52|nr:LLM class flavin-dependent oxidoreductase [Pantoea agglomerans]MDQ0435571.1 FMN-dependent oxidoreductase (nitrilotriacetate monooxygenase family) [Pantoea agglomerans]NEG88333.1 NtaA/DmoA family FMN-dependent monooxygenase [Pantoea agglomerans]NEH10353.1 NtaA/DmoA family FMN-dependent monooxygenase [Pantoea agglomerans]TCZ24914.1 LLM class flavin-dependent oxidoreductase [Pantoea agglomerans]WNK46921.1 LLM class flavin-dependent oxidoreductase [Pantoea agglomerans]